jgi:hypothetical protein
MSIPDEFIGRVCKTKLPGLISNYKKFDKIIEEWPGSELDVIYERVKSHEVEARIVVVFETTEDCLAFTLKYGKEYV